MSLLNVIERKRNVGKYVYRAEHTKTCENEGRFFDIR